MEGITEIVEDLKALLHKAEAYQTDGKEGNEMLHNHSCRLLRQALIDWQIVQKHTES